MINLSIIRYVLCFTDGTDEEDDAHEPDKNEIQDTLRTLGTKLEAMNTCNVLVKKHGVGLQQAIGDLEQPDNLGEYTANIKAANERASLLRLSSNTMINVSQFILNYP